MENRAKSTVLIVDDEPLSVEMLRLTLEDGFRTLLATSGREALKIVAQESPDIILLDVVMPGMDGYQVCQALKGDPLQKEIPILFITCMDESECEIRGLELGAADYIVKPFNPGIVMLRLNNHLELKRQRDLLAFHTAELRRVNDGLAREIGERCRVQEEHERLIVELQAAAAKVRTLSGLLPICASCKKIRDDKGYWNQLESYICAHTDVEFSHGLCTECMQRLYPGYKPK